MPPRVSGVGPRSPPWFVASVSGVSRLPLGTSTFGLARPRLAANGVAIVIRRLYPKIQRPYPLYTGSLRQAIRPFAEGRQLGIQSLKMAEF